MIAREGCILRPFCFPKPCPHPEQTLAKPSSPGRRLLLIRPPISPPDVRAGHRTVYEIVVGSTRLRVDRDGAGKQTYFVNDQRCDVNAYLAVTQAYLNRGVACR